MNLPAIKISNGESMPSLIVGTFQHKKYDSLKSIVSASIQSGYTGFDTAPSYGNEQDLGKAIKECTSEQSISRDKLFIIDKIDGWQMYQSNGKIAKYAEDSLKKLRIDYFDLLLIHWPFPDFFIQTWENFIELFKMAKAKSIGICNVNETHLRLLAEKTGFDPHVVQVERHPLRTENNLIQYNTTHNIVTQAYSPVCRMMEPLAGSDLLKNLEHKYQKNKGQIIMRWHIDTGSVPVFMTHKIDRLKEYAQIFDFKLDDYDINAISSLNQDYKIFLESIACPGF